MTVLHCGTGNLYGGVEKLLSSLAKAKMLSRFALCFPGDFADELRSVGASVDILGATKFSRPWTVWQARRRLRNIEADCYVFHGCWAFATLAPAIKHRRRILAIHDVPQGKHWVERLARRTRPDGIIANSRVTGMAASRLFPNVPIAIASPAIPQTEVLTNSQKTSLRQSFHVQESNVVILLASRFDHIKGHRVLISALSQLELHKHWTAWIAGAPQRDWEEHYLSSLKQLAEQHQIQDRIQFLGHRDDVPRLMQAADIYCQPNLGPEGFGISFVEAMRAGLPVVTSAIGGALELIDESRGILVPPNQVEAVAQALERLLANPSERQRLGQAAREWSSHRFTLEAVGQRWRDLTDGVQEFHGEIFKAD